MNQSSSVAEEKKKIIDNFETFYHNYLMFKPILPWSLVFSLRKNHLYSEDECPLTKDNLKVFFPSFPNLYGKVNCNIKSLEFGKW